MSMSEAEQRAEAKHLVDTAIEYTDDEFPDAPDPLWPPGVEPTHLSVEKRKNPEFVEAFTHIAGDLWKCEKCGTTTFQSISDSRYCTECYTQETKNTKLAQRTNANWMEQAAELGLAIFERQPEESHNEWRIWTKYREYYPRKMPTWSELAAACGVVTSTVVRAANKWSYRVRLAAWASYTDSEIQDKRIEAIKEMNQKQLSMAQTIQDKLATAIDRLDPNILRPGEIVNLFKVATELERRVTTYVDEKVESESAEARARQVSLTKPEDLNDVIGVLKSAGLLDGKNIGIEQTTRLVAKEKDE